MKNNIFNIEQIPFNRQISYDKIKLTLLTRATNLLSL